VSKHLFAFLLSELTVVRIICRNPQCQTVVEMPVAALANKPIVRCQQCGEDFNPTQDSVPPINVFAEAVRRMQALNKVIDLEFVLPAPPS
jgi:hypothetical protein